MSITTETESKTLEETAKFLGERAKFLSPMVKVFMEAAVDHLKKGYSGLDVAEALSVACASANLMYVPKKLEDKIKEESIELYKVSIETMRENEIGKNNTISAQIIAQAKVLSFMASSAAQSIKKYQEKASKEDHAHE